MATNDLLCGRHTWITTAHSSKLKAQFQRSAYGCRLYCCWCAQDIEANRFWEALGFVPLAYRAGSEKRRRVHIFWQKRIREADDQTPWWFPSQTQGGSMEDRLVLPIPPGTHWSEQMPLLLPGGGHESVPARSHEGDTSISRGSTSRRSKPKPPAPPRTPMPLSGGLCFAPPAPQIEKKPRAKKLKARNDPKLIAVARELRDRYLEEVARNPNLILPTGKYEVTRALPGAEPLPYGRGSLPRIVEVKALPQAA